ncbi:hypothetical protein [Kitasatospora cineracea]|uniref:hypothetical protein n=1 Tax=Kitasatospora cineracea TaxID=88074 RepID=UPI0033FBDFF9
MRLTIRILVPVLVALVAFMAGRVSVDPDPSGPAVVHFNDGFSDAKADDCGMGFESACEWLEATK